MPTAQQVIIGFENKSFTVDPGQTVNTVLMAETDQRSLKLLVNYKVGTKIKAFELFVSNTENGPEDTINARVGNNLNILSQTQIIGTDVVLSVTNNEAVVASVTILQLN